jgi:hypothetical protein
MKPSSIFWGSQKCAMKNPEFLGGPDSIAPRSINQEIENPCGSDLAAEGFSLLLCPAGRQERRAA